MGGAGIHLAQAYGQLLTKTRCGSRSREHQLRKHPSTQCLRGGGTRRGDHVCTGQQFDFAAAKSEGCGVIAGTDTRAQRVGIARLQGFRGCLLDRSVAGIKER